MGKSTYEILRAFSEKDFDVTKSIEPRKFSKKVSSVINGIIKTTSGYLEVCDAWNVDAYREASNSINFNSPKWRVPYITQGDGFVTFSNLFGDGLFAVLSSAKRFYVETESPTSNSDEVAKMIQKGDVEEMHGSRKYILEGLVGVGGGRMAIIDPEISPVSIDSKREKYFEMSTILKVKPGIYTCRFIDKNKKLSIKKISA